MKVVLDTNVIISGLTYHGNERRVLDLAKDGRFEIVLSPVILNEVERVLARKFQRQAQDIAHDVSDLRRIATVIDPAPQADAVPDAHPDNRILDCAAAAEADFLVTGDRRHLLPLGEHRGARILNAADFLDTLAQ